MSFTRYAVFVTPPPGEMADFCARWLGWDAANGQACAPPDIGRLPRPVDRLTATPRRYGFHGTIKPPFRLAEGTSEAGLKAALAEFCAGQAPVTAGTLAVAEMGPFLALRPDRPTPALDALAGRAVAALDGFRAPLDEAALARRLAAGLTAAEEANLVRWGYPYVMDAFAYHMTLTGPLEPETRAVVLAALADTLDPLVPRPYPIDDMTLLGEGPDGRFRHVARFALSG